MSVFYSWQRENKRTLLLGGQGKRIWGFAEGFYDTRSLLRYVGAALGVLLCLRKRLRRRR